MGLERFDDMRGADGAVMIAEDGVALRSAEAGKDFSTGSCGAPGNRKRTRAITDEVAGDQDEIGLEGVGLPDDLFQEPGLGVLLQVDVADLDDAEVLEGIGKVGDGEGAVHDLELMSAVRGRIGGNAKPCEGGAGQESAACDEVRSSVRAAARTRVHSP